MKATTHPLSPIVLGARASLITLFIAISNSYLENLHLPDTIQKALPTISQALIVIIVEFALFQLLACLNERHRKKQIIKYQSRRDKLEERMSSLPSLNPELRKKTQNAIDTLDKKIIDLHVEDTEIKLEIPSEATE